MSNRISYTAYVHYPPRQAAPSGLAGRVSLVILAGSRQAMMTHRTTASFGKRQESIAVAELLRRGFDVSMTLVDDQQIDCIVRQEQNGKQP